MSDRCEAEQSESEGNRRKRNINDDLRTKPELLLDMTAFSAL